MGTEVKNIVNDVLSACISSCRSEPISLYEPTYTKGYFSIHSQLHVMFNAPPGFGKSTLLEGIPADMKVETVDYTKAGILGTIKKTGEVVEGAITRAAGKVWIVDEHHKIPDSAKGAITSLLENQRASRALGYNILGNFVSPQSDYIAMKVDKNIMTMEKVRFSALFAGIYQFKKRWDDRALASRFLPVTFMLDWEDLEKVGIGHKAYSPVYSYSPGGQKFDDYERFWKVYLAVVKSMPRELSTFFMQKPEFPRRQALQIVRLLSWSARSNSIIDDWEKYLQYIPLFIFNTVTSTLTLGEYDVLQRIYNGMKNKAIATDMNVSEPVISRISKRLSGLGLTQNLEYIKSVD